MNKKILKKKILAQIRLIVFEKDKKTHTLIQNKMTSPNRKLGYSNNQLNY